MKKLAIIVFLLAVLTALLMRGCTAKPMARVIEDFYRDKQHFDTVTDYFADFDWDGYGLNAYPTKIYNMKFARYYGLHLHADMPASVPESGFPALDDQTKKSVWVLFYKLGYDRIQRTTRSGSTVTFIVKTGSTLDFYYHEGVCYVIDGGPPKPAFGAEYAVETVIPLGDNWYYWDGHCYPGKPRKHKN